MVGAVAALLASVLTAVAAVYGHRGANRATREGSALTGYDALTRALVAERDKAEGDEAAAEARAFAAEARASAAEAQVSAQAARVSQLEAENTRLRQRVTLLGGTP